MFDMFVFQGHGLKSIATTLNDLGVDSPEWHSWKRAGSKGEPPFRSGRVLPNAWSQSTVRAILRNSVYAGRLIWKRKKRVMLTDPATLKEKHIRIPYPESEWVV